MTSWHDIVSMTCLAHFHKAPQEPQLRCRSPLFSCWWDCQTLWSRNNIALHHPDLHLHADLASQTIFFNFMKAYLNHAGPPFDFMITLSICCYHTSQVEETHLSVWLIVNFDVADGDRSLFDHNHVHSIFLQLILEAFCNFSISYCSFLSDSAIRTVSSAYHKLFRLTPPIRNPASSWISLQIFTVYRLNRSGEKMHLCLTPFLIWTKLPSAFSILTTADWYQ